MLNSKQKSYLKSLASSEPAMFQIGKDALSDNLIRTVDNGFNTHELIKVKVLKTAPEEVKELAFDLAMNTHSEIVQIIGRTIVLYRKADDPKIILP
ncbi:ribosome assembly RNA-binding protein YhbY [Erysipelotrichaceae bacterium Oil+RF-744-GAM-WT-6]|jgi:RNA-binding protein|uniref:Ribosome assembly RNA-binding protein YhbY n=1 Tax=Stecheria intestinalis TaxID=2606630 RepID=A0A7X2NSU3_9FIRM|nr:MULTISPECIES: ribosome assembly RNA-binding protein YhbY [Erysipelotrichaceae]MCI2154751.1 ribosome assembly RNA-binding protein YhbY [Solobacterium sp.]MDY3234544.1 ribosome assembly RNA-binding protein YhbY [Erysipelotrichaceae bacterium]MDY4681044.1 ribosome assembly RNA-binding protein YhbY [Lachnospiraceae bacterium]MCI6746652.1 ribosome assembly RNA-binding protein YhbY [Anaerolactibacter massiliensis]MDD5882224.1 ribosome assembly RNA-binding protein YhbY [Stecheria intestinalis]